MKKFILFFSILIFNFNFLFAQTPQAFQYQTVVRDATGEIIQNQNVSFRFSVHDNYSYGAIVFSETHTVMTNQFGLANLEIGTGVPVSGTFSTINWGANSKYLEVELDPAGGNSFISMGTTQLLSVPYALYSENTANTDDADADATNELQTLSINGNDLSISDGNTVTLPGSGLTNIISDTDGDTWIDTEINNDNDSIVFFTSGMERMVISEDGAIEVNGQLSATGFTGDGSGLTSVPGDDLGDHTATEDLDMANNRITNLVSPTTDTEAATKLYVDTQISLSGDNLGNHTATEDLDIDNNRIINLDTPVDNADAATKLYVDSHPGDNLGNHVALQNIELNSNWLSNDGNNLGIYVDNAGNVGVNTDSPSHVLSVDGDIRSHDLIISSYGSTSNASYRFGYGYENSGFSSPYANSVAVITNDETRMIVRNTGNVGIGTSSPGATLDVEGHIWQTGTGESVFIGEGAGANDDFSDNRNVFLGYYAGNANTFGNQNLALGYKSLYTNTTGYKNTASGFRSLYTNTTGHDNTANGNFSLFSNTEGDENTANGSYSLYKNTTGSYNSASGCRSLYFNTTGNNNIAMGYNAGENITTGSNNIIIGYDIDAPDATVDNQMSIGNLIFATGVDGTGTSISSGNVGIGVSSPQELLHVEGSIRMVDGNEAAGKIMTSDANGTASWAEPPSADDNDWEMDGADMYSEVSGNVGIGTTTPGANLDVGGHIWQTGTGSSVFVGEGAGSGDDLSDNQNVFIGNDAGNVNTTGDHNIALGYKAGENISTG
ncbi:MAG: hypothetical protein K8R58_10895, partial [Bacteroidales bacterium]|nr:hypothetical protein [Bacteroidales bacterium]